MMAARKKRPSVGPELVTKKGEAKASTQPEALPRGTKDTIAVTVRLDEARYRQLTAFGAAFAPRRTHQQIVVEALDEYFANHAS
jgi:hypothetical protein